MLGLTLDYDIWNYPDREIFLRLEEGVSNTLEFEENGQPKTAKDIPNILLSANRITTQETKEHLVMEFFKKMLLYRTYSEDNPILIRCLNDIKTRHLALSYFIKNHFDSQKALSMSSMIQRLLFKYLILDATDANFALHEIRSYTLAENLKHNPFYRTITADLAQNVSTEN